MTPDMIRSGDTFALASFPDEHAVALADAVPSQRYPGAWEVEIQHLNGPPKGLTSARDNWVLGKAEDFRLIGRDVR